MDDGPCPPIPVPNVQDPDDPPLVGIAVIEMTVFGEVVPCVIVAGFGTHLDRSGTPAMSR